MYLLLYPLAIKQAARSAGFSSPARSWRLTSSPTSKWQRPIAGPNQACSCSGGLDMLCTVFSISPAAIPRQPACTMATSSPRALASNTGKQSAVSTQQATPGVCVSRASALIGSRAESMSAMPDPCSCRSHCKLSEPGKLSSSTARFCRSESIESPTWAARLRLA